MHKRKAEYDIADRINDGYARSGNPVLPDSVFGHLGHFAGFPGAKRTTTAPLGPRRVRKRWALLAALAVCVGQSVADAHLHLDEEEEVCTFCAISEPGHVPDTGQVLALPPESRRPDRLPEYSATLSPRPYEAARPRAPPVSAS